MTGIEVYTKYLLRSDLEALQEVGRIDLEELGLTSQADQEEDKIGMVFLLPSIGLLHASGQSHPLGKIPLKQ